MQSISTRGKNERLLAQAVRHHQAGKPREAERLCRQVLRETPEHAEALNLVGTLAVQAGKADAGIEYIGRAARLRPANPVFLYNLGLAQQAAAKRDAAIASYRQALRIAPEYVDALTNLGGLLLNQGETEAAVACFRKLVRLAPRNAMGHGNLGTALLARGAFDEAAPCFREALRLKPDYADAHNGLGATFLALEQYSEAAASLAAALRYDPGHVRAHNNLGLNHVYKGRFEEAITSFRAALQLNPAYAEAHLNLGKTNFEFGRFDQAEASYREALRIKPDRLGARLCLAKVFEEQEDFNAAIEIYDEVLNRSPDHDLALTGKAFALRRTGRIEAADAIMHRLVDAGKIPLEEAELFVELAGGLDGKSWTDASRSEVIEKLENVLEGSFLKSEARRMVHFTLGGLHDRLGAYDEAFSHYTEGNLLRPTPFKLDTVQAHNTQRLAFFTRGRMARLPHAANCSEVPVFIVGMPRSGTSLVEQILACHPNVFGAGELRDIGAIVNSFKAAEGSDGFSAEFLSHLDQDMLDTAAERHLERLHELAGDAKRVTNKMPYNFMNLGLISLLFPRARIIHCLRDPLDTCLSCYFQNFRTRNFHAFDLRHVGGYYVQYRRLMEHWRDVLDIPIFTVRYEEHVAEPEKVCREMLAFLDLEWDPQCLRFHESRRVVRTASRDQVREPIYTRSVARWRNYERHLGPLKEALAEVL